MEELKTEEYTQNNVKPQLKSAMSHCVEMNEP